MYLKLISNAHRLDVYDKTTPIMSLELNLQGMNDTRDVA